MDNPEAQKICLGCACMCCSVFMILVVSGISSLQPNEYGLDYSAVSK